MFVAELKPTHLTACLFPETALVVPSELQVLLFEVLEIPQGQDGRAPYKTLLFLQCEKERDKTYSLQLMLKGAN